MSPKVRRARKVASSLLVALAAPLAHGATAHANGRFPAANQLVVDPDDPQHVVVRATYGTMISHDGGRTLSLVCEQAIGATGDADPMLGLFSGGTMVAGVVSGLAATKDEGCSWTLMPGFLPHQYVVDVTVQKDDPRSGLVVSSTARDGGGFHTVLFETSDGAASFRPTGPPLGEDFLALTVEVAPSDPKRIYVSGTASAEGGVSQVPTIMRSDNRGRTFRRTSLSAFGNGYSAWISAVDPGDPARLYVRVRSTDKDRLLVSSDGARTFREVFVAQGSLTGFALSPDGSHVALGGAGDGIQLASTKDFSWTRVSDVHAQCLTWTKAGIYACGVEWLDHFVVGLSTDLGKSFAPLSHMSDPCPVRCGAETTVALVCTDELWRATRASIKQPPGTCGQAVGSVGSALDDAGVIAPGKSLAPDSRWRAPALGALVLFGLGAAIAAVRARRRR